MTLRSMAVDLTALAGLALVTFGAAQMYPPLAWIVPGLALVAVAVCLAVAAVRQRRNQR